MRIEDDERATEDEVTAIRALLRERMEASSVRRVAAEVGCNPSTLHKFVTEETQPQPKMRVLYQGWYARQRESGVQSSGPQAEALRALTEHLSPRLQPIVEGTLVATLRRVHASVGVEPPRWLADYGAPGDGRKGYGAPARDRGRSGWS